MDIKRELRVIDKSIAKWKSIRDGIGIDGGGRNCALCQEHEACEGCPVYAFSNRRFCVNTPYNPWVIHLCRFHKRSMGDTERPAFALCPTCRELAQDEINFLNTVRWWITLQEGER